MSKVLITSRSFGEISEQPLAILKENGFEIDFMRQYDADKFASIIPEYDYLIIGGHKFDPELMEKCPKLKLIAKHGAGLDNIPLEKAKQLGITVTYTPGTNSNAVADLAIGLMLNLTRKISFAQSDVRGGNWKTVMGEDLCFKSLSLIGFGAIAKNVARRALGFGMKIVAYDPFVKEVPEEFAGKVELVSLEECLRNGDIVSLHLPLNDDTKGMISFDQIAMMKEGSYLINTSRGGIVDEDALEKALASGKLKGAALDVVANEPLREDHPLRKYDNCIITPHIGMYSKEAIGAVSLICARNVAAKEKGEPLQHVVV